MKTLLGIDYGTGGCKVTALGTDGSFVGEASVEYTTYHDHPGWSEQEPQDWWDALCAALRKLKDKGVDLSSVAAAALDGSTHNAVLMDASYRPIRRTIMWTDQRAVAECAQLRETMGDKIFKTAYQMPAPTWTLPQLMWLKAHEPDVLARTEHVLFVKDYVRYLLTGNAATDRIEAQGTLFFNMAKMDWDEELVQMAGLSPASLPSFIAPTDIAGHVAAAAAAATGLPEGMPVVCGSSDSAVEDYGAGAVEPGDLILKLATAGNVTIYLPIDDGRGRVVLGGVARELFDLSVADIRHPAPVAGFRPPPPAWLDPDSTPEARAAGPRLETGFNPDGYVLALEELLLREGVRILYDTRVCAALRDGDRVTHLAVENKSGRTAVACGAVVDATGDADVCFLAGEPTVSIDANVAGGWFYTVQDGGKLWLHTSSHAFDKDAGKGNGAEGPFFRGDDGEQVTGQVLATRDLIRRGLANLRAEHPDEDFQPFKIPTIACFRMTRRLADIRQAAAEQHACELRLFKTFDPAPQTGQRPLGHKGLVLGRRGKKINVSEAVVGGEERVQPIQQGLHLAAHLIVVDRRDKHQGIRALDLFGDRGGVVSEHAFFGLLADEAAPAEADLFVLQADPFDPMPGGLCAADHFLREPVGIAPGPQTRCDDHDSAHFRCSFKNASILSKGIAALPPPS